MIGLFATSSAVTYPFPIKSNTPNAWSGYLYIFETAEQINTLNKKFYLEQYFCIKNVPCVGPYCLLKCEIILPKILKIQINKKHTF